jgi:serine acetyltransferase
MQFHRILLKSFTGVVSLLAWVDSRLYMKTYLKILRTSGITLTGTPRYIAPSAYFDEFRLISLGERVVISRDVKFLTHDYSVTTAQIAIGTAPPTDVRRNGPIVLGDNVFVGLGAILLPNTNIGANTVIGAGSVVRGRVPGGSVVMGNPAKTLMSIEEYARITYAKNPSWTLEADPT